MIGVILTSDARRKNMLDAAGLNRLKWRCRRGMLENDLFIQDQKMRNTLRIIMGEEVIDHSGLDYYEGS